MIIVGNGVLVTRNEQNEFFENGAVVCKDNLIFDYGNTEEMKNKYNGADFIDAKGGVIMPGLINTHEHIYSSFARGMSIAGYNPKNFMDILEGMWWKLDRKLSLDDVKYSALATYIDCIKCGVTTVFDHHASFGAIDQSLFRISEVAKKLGMRTCLCYEVSDRDGKEKTDQAIKENAEFIKYAHEDKNDMQKGMMGLHAAFTLTNETLEKCREQTPDYTGFHVHVAEGLDDVIYSLKYFGKRVVNRLFDLDILGKNTIAVHCIHVNGVEMDILKATDTMVVHNPESNMGNAVGCSSIFELLKKGIVLGLGTDGYTHDMFESYKVANILHKHNLGNPAVAWNEIPTMLFENNRKIANRFFETPLGVIKKDAAADIITVDYEPLTPMTVDNINAHILFGMTGKSVVNTMVNGKVLMKNRELVNIDEKMVMAKCRELASALSDRVNTPDSLAGYVKMGLSSLFDSKSK